MKINRLKPENPIVIIDEEELKELTEIAKLNEESIEQRSTDKFLEYVKNYGVSLDIHINGVDKVIRYGNVVVEKNYDERGYMSPVSDTLKENIADDISDYINEFYSDYKIKCKSFLEESFKNLTWKYELKIKFWKRAFYLITLVSIILLIILLCTN